MLLPEVGEAGQRALRDASVLVVGAGGLGCPTALYLAAAGVGRIGIVDDDVVDATNLHRQVLYATDDVGTLKVVAAAARLDSLNPEIRIVPYATRVTDSNVDALIAGFDIIADGTDTFASRYLINDACVRAGKPNAFASVSQFSGQASVFGAPGGPCYRCVFPDPPPLGAVPSCAEGGVLGVLPGLLGMIQATEVIKLIIGFGEPLVGRLLLADAATMRFHEVVIERDTACRACGDNPSSPLVHPIIEPTLGMALSERPLEISVGAYYALREGVEAPFLLDVRTPHEYAEGNIGGHLLPVQELAMRLDEIANHKEDPLIIIQCRSGARSAAAVRFLRDQGFAGACNLTGGLLAWKREIDPSVSCT